VSERSFLFCTRYDRTLKEPRFRWAACQIDALQDCLDYPRLRQALLNLPKTLDETYARILEGISEGYLAQAMTILKLLIWSDWRFTVNQLVDAVATNVDEDPGFDPKNRMPVPWDVLKLCSSLVVVTQNRRDPGTEVVQLAHFSVKEYLVSNHVSEGLKSSMDEKVARSYLVRLCLTYLMSVSQLTMEDRPVSSLDSTDIESEFPFVSYSANYWMSHAREVENGDERLRKIVLSFFLEEHKALSLFAWLYHTSVSISFNGERHPLYYAARGGLTCTVENLLVCGANVNAGDGEALLAAVMWHRDTTVQLLLERGADVDAGNGQPLISAAAYGRDTTVKLLLDGGANTNARDGQALINATSQGRDTIVQLLIDHSADPDAGEGEALRIACGRGFDTIARLLLDSGANVNARDGMALCSACEKGFDTIVRLLLASGADVHARDGMAVSLASQGGYGTTVQLLLDSVVKDVPGSSANQTHT
jgi:hypothetical protein